MQLKKSLKKVDASTSTAFMKVEFYKHNIDQGDIKNVTKALKETFLTTGTWVKKFETNLCRYVQAQNAVAVTSCTEALHLALMAYGIGPGSEVITTPMSFIATANAIEYVGAKPIFVDIEPDTGNINANLIEAAITKKTRAIIPVHLYGQLCDMKKISAIARKHKLIVIEDAAHALEGRRADYQVGTLSDMACYSFYATKSITAGEGGALTLNDDTKAVWLRMARLHGMAHDAAERYQLGKFRHQSMSFLGLKANMSNIQAALLINQLKKVESRLKKREKIARYYQACLENHPQIELLKIIENSRPARHLFVIKVPAKKRDQIVYKLHEAQIGAAVNYLPIYWMEYYQKKYRYPKYAFPEAADFGSRVISLPLYPKLTKTEQDYVIGRLLKIIKLNTKK